MHWRYSNEQTVQKQDSKGPALNGAHSLKRLTDGYKQ